LGSIRPNEIRSWAGGLVAEGLAPATAKKVVQLLSAALEQAVDDGVIVRSPVRGVSLPTTTPREMRFLSHEEIALLADAIDPRHRALVITAAYTGARFGELAAVRTGNLNLLRRTLTVAETLTEVQGQIMVGPPKTRSSKRQVSLPRYVCETISRHLDQYGVGHDGLVFTAAQGGPLRRTLFRRRTWLPAVAASVGEPCRFHDLRHSHAALLIAEQVHPKVLQERLGHSSIRTTLDVYGHLFDGLDEAAADALDDALSRSSVGFSWG
jgi:integrase